MSIIGTSCGRGGESANLVVRIKGDESRHITFCPSLSPNWIFFKFVFLQLFGQEFKRVRHQVSEERFGFVLD